MNMELNCQQIEIKMIMGGFLMIKQWKRMLYKEDNI